VSYVFIDTFCLFFWVLKKIEHDSFVIIRPSYPFRNHFCWLNKPTFTVNLPMNFGTIYFDTVLTVELSPKIVTSILRLQSNCTRCNYNFSSDLCTYNSQLVLADSVLFNKFCRLEPFNQNSLLKFTVKLYSFRSILLITTTFR